MKKQETLFTPPKAKVGDIVIFKDRSVYFQAKVNVAYFEKGEWFYRFKSMGFPVKGVFPESCVFYVFPRNNEEERLKDVWKEKVDLRLRTLEKKL